MAEEKEEKVGFIADMLSSGSKISSKRVITFLAFLLMAVGYVSNLYFDFEVNAEYFEAMEWIVIAGLGVTASERFTKKEDKK